MQVSVLKSALPRGASPFLSERFFFRSCRYCRGKKQLDCPICAVEDEYGWAYDTEKGKDGPEKTPS